MYKYAIQKKKYLKESWFDWNKVYWLSFEIHNTFRVRKCIKCEQANEIQNNIVQINKYPYIILPLSKFFFSIWRPTAFLYACFIKKEWLFCCSFNLIHSYILIKNVSSFFSSLFFFFPFFYLKLKWWNLSGFNGKILTEISISYISFFFWNAFFHVPSHRKNRWAHIHMILFIWQQCLCFDRLVWICL